MTLRLGDTHDMRGGEDGPAFPTRSPTLGHSTSGFPAVADILSKEARSLVMSRIRATNTGPERVVFQILRRRGVYFARHAKSVIGHPDLVFRRYRLAVFIDGEFWHGKDFKRRQAKLSDYWVEKITRNMRRDKSSRARLRSLGWRVLKFWGRDVLRDPEKCVDRILAVREECIRIHATRMEVGDKQSG